MRCAFAKPISTYLFVYLALLVLLGATVEISFVKLGMFALIPAISIASVKAILVVWYFMHAREESPLVIVFLGLALFLLLISLVLTFGDYLTRS